MISSLFCLMREQIAAMLKASLAHLIFNMLGKLFEAFTDPFGAFKVKSTVFRFSNSCFNSESVEFTEKKSEFEVPDRAFATSRASLKKAAVVVT